MRATLLHAVRDPGGDGGRVRGISGAGILLTGSRIADYDWWRTYFDDRYLLEYEPLFAEERDRREVARLIDLLGLPDGARILDVPCGQGRHSHLLARAGYRVDGLDYSRDLLAHAAGNGTVAGLAFRRGDMRKLPARWTGRFDAVVNLFTSFGFFADPKDDQRVIAEIARVLKAGGQLVWHGASRDGVMARFLARDWWATSDGTIIAQERSFDPLSGILTVSTRQQGRAGAAEREHRIRLYTATRMAELFAAAGLIVTDAQDGWSGEPLRRSSSEMLLLGRKE